MQLKYDGKVIQKEEDLYRVDCNVTGLSCGTADDPTSALLQYFQELVFELVNDLVKVGGQYEEYQHVFQDDIAGPHEDKQNKKGVEEYCEREGWKWIPQGPQIPHVNVYNLLVSPNMSKPQTVGT